MRKKFQVFISSTFTDLKIERQACVEAILRAGHIPAGMELFSAGSETQLQVIKRWIKESDIYMLLLGARYGTLEQNSGYSYTEVEYRYAHEIGKPSFAIVMSDDLIQKKVKLGGTDVIELDNQQKFRDFKELVLSKVSRFYRDDSEIKLAIFESLNDIQTMSELIGWVKANEVPEVKNFKKQLEDLSEKNKMLEDQLISVGLNKSNIVGDYTYNEMLEILDNIKILVPGRFRLDKIDFKINLTNILITQRQAFALGLSGVNFSNGSNVYFLISDVVPHLRIYELVEAVKYGQNNQIKYQTSKNGNRFIALYMKNNEVPVGPFNYQIQ